MNEGKQGARSDGVKVAVELAHGDHARHAIVPAGVLPFESATSKDANGNVEAEAALGADLRFLLIVPIRQDAAPAAPVAR